MTLTSVGILGGQRGSLVSSNTSVTSRSMPRAARPTWSADRPAAYVPLGAKGGGWDVQRPQETPEKDSKKEKKMIDQIGEMVEGKAAEVNREETVLKERTDEGPPNPKKRMYEQKDNLPQMRDEL